MRKHLNLLFIVAASFWPAALVSAQTCATISKSAVGWWPANGDSKDALTGETASVSGGVTFAEGQAGKAFAFDGTGEVAVANRTVLNPTNITIEAWVFPTKMDGDVDIIVNKEGPSAAPIQFEIGLRGTYANAVGTIPFGNLAFFLGGVTGLPSDYSGWVNGGASVPLNSWSHVALTYDGTKVVTYLNGAAARTVTGLSGSITTGSGALKIGSRSSGVTLNLPAVRFNGMIDDIAVYNGAISSSEIAAIYQAGSLGKCPALPGPTISSQPLSGAYKVGDAIALSVIATGSGALSYKWFFQETEIQGATLPQLRITGAAETNSGVYAVEVTDQNGTTRSASATVTVAPCASQPADVIALFQGESISQEGFASRPITASGGVTIGSGMVGGGYNFDGSGGLSIPSDSSLSLRNFTIEGWIFPTVLDGETESIICKEENSGVLSQHEYNLAIRGPLNAGSNQGTIPLGNLCFYIAGITNLPDEYYGWVDGRAFLPLNTWSHIALTFDESTIRIYLNAELTRTISGLQGFPPPSNAPLRIGSRAALAISQYPGDRFNGRLDELSIYKRALGSSEIAAIVRADAVGKCPSAASLQILAQPEAATVAVGGTASFALIAAGPQPLAYEWFLNDVLLPGQSNNVLTLTNIQLAQAGALTARVSDGIATLASSSAELTVVAPPVITRQPTNLTVNVGDDAAFTVGASGSSPLAYVWRKSGVPFFTNAVGTFVLTNVQTVSAGSYSVRISNSAGTVTSASATLTVLLPQAQVRRELPAAYFPGTALTVKIKIPTLTGVQAYAIEESVPGTWGVSDASDGGSFDESTGKLKFGPFLDPASRELSYKATPPATATGAKIFTGSVSADGKGYPVVGDTTTSFVSYHPADVDPSDNRITANELTAYAAAWKSGAAWAVEPNPIPIDYVTRAGAIWKNGELYSFDGNRPAPVWWVIPPKPQSLQALTAATGNAAVREILGSFIVIHAAPAASVFNYAIEEALPAGATCRSVAQGGQIDQVNRKVKWGPFLDSAPRDLSYELVPSAGVKTALPLQGVVSFDGISEPITGVQQWALARFASVTLESNALTIRFSGIPDNSYRIERSSDLIHWEQFKIVSSSATGDLQFAVPIQSGTGAQFYRAAAN